MHACGHDGHTATLMLVAAVLKQQEATLPSKVSLFFQPAEEGGHGAKYMIEDGALENVDAIYGWHNWPALEHGTGFCPDGPIFSANASFTIHIKGQGGHASQPEACRDPLLAGAAVVMALQQIVSRRGAPQDPIVLSVTSFDAASSPTVIRDHVTIEGSMSAEDIRRYYHWGSDPTLPTGARFSAIERDTSTEIALSWDTVQSRQYQLQTTTNLMDATTWEDAGLGIMQGVDGEITRSIPYDQSVKRFFRVRPVVPLSP